MAIQVSESKDGKVIEVAVSGKLTDEDYQQFIPHFEQLAGQNGKIRLLFEMTQFHGWEVKAAWDDLKLGLKHYGKVERIAMVGEKKWQQWMAQLSKPFTAAEVRYFEKSESPQALAWLEEGPG
jgi:uncharacterized protein (DUF1778 family)